jgi:hypothetical protein
MMLGVLTFKRKGGGHVGIYVGEDVNAIMCLVETNLTWYY